MFFLRRLLGNSSFLLLSVLTICILAGHLFPLPVIQFFYGMSLSIKEILLFVLPVVIFTYLSSCVLSLKNGALVFMTVLIGMVLASNLFSILSAYIAEMAHLVAVAPRSEQSFLMPTLTPLWTFSLPMLCRNDYALFGGLCTGFILTYWPNALIEEKILSRLKDGVDFFMNRFFMPLLPLFIAGFILKLKYEGILDDILREYASVFGVIFIFQGAYLGLMYGIAANFKPRAFWGYIRNIFPAALAGFTTMSSAAAMPLSILCAERNTQSPETARAVIPATLNIHMIGDSIAIPIMVMVVLRTFGFAPLGFWEYVLFTSYFMIAKFGIIGVPGGSILVMVPILESKFGFTAEMSALVTALYILFDPIITVANVSGNGAFAILFNKIMQKRKKEVLVPA